MAATIVNVRSTNDVAVIDVTWNLDADVTAVVPHGITGGILQGGGIVPEGVWLGSPPAPGTAAAQRLGAVAIAAVDATNVTLSKTNAAGSSVIVTRLYVARRGTQFSAANTAVTAAIAGAMTA